MRKSNIICDLDGTLALDDHRAHLIQSGPLSRQWTEYFALCGEDALNEPIVEILDKFEESHKIYILTGRSDQVYEETVKWLGENRIPYWRLIMRDKDDRTDDHLLKIKWAMENNLRPENTLFVLEDRQRVVDAWRAAGYTCLQVAPGAF